MSRVVTRSLRKQLEKGLTSTYQEHTQEQDEEKMQSMGDEPMNAPNTNVK
jgi:hypothetical protein